MWPQRSRGSASTSQTSSKNLETVIFNLYYFKSYLNHLTQAKWPSQAARCKAVLPEKVLILGSWGPQVHWTTQDRPIFVFCLLSYHRNLWRSCPDQQDEPWWYWRINGQGNPLPLQSHPITIACCNQHLHQLLTSRLRRKVWACKLDIVPIRFFICHTHMAVNFERYDLIVLHSWTFLAVTFADAKVVKHVESVMSKE